MLRHGAVVLGRDGTGYSTRYRPPVGVEVDVTRQDDTTVGVRHVLFLAAHFLTVSSPSPAPHVSRFLVGAVDHSTIERLSAARTFNPHIRASRGGLDKAIRRCKAGVSEDEHRSGANSVRDCDFSLPSRGRDNRVPDYQERCSRSVNLARG